MQAPGRGHRGKRGACRDRPRGHGLYGNAIGKQQPAQPERLDRAGHVGGGASGSGHVGGARGPGSGRVAGAGVDDADDAGVYDAAGDPLPAGDRSGALGGPNVPSFTPSAPSDPGTGSAPPSSGQPSSAPSTEPASSPPDAGGGLSLSRDCPDQTTISALTPYTCTLTASGGTPPYQWTRFVDGAIDYGYSLDGLSTIVSGPNHETEIISGKPGGQWTYHITETVNDSEPVIPQVSASTSWTLIVVR